VSEVTLHLGDCLDVLPTLAAGSVDLICADMPYPDLKGGYAHTFDGVAKTHRETVSVGVPWNTDLAWIAQAKRVCRLGLMVFCTYHSIDAVAAACADLRKVALVTWYKRNAAPTGKNVPHFTTEFIWCFAKDVGLKWDALKTTMFDIPNLAAGCMASERIVNDDGSALHPTQKPLALMLELLRVVLPGQSVLDPFMGTGTTGLAAHKLGLSFVGVERDPGYFAVAQKRIAAAQAQLALPLFAL
jgi:modification methylase